MLDLRESVERRRVARSALLGDNRAHRGQFFTPRTAADLIASMAAFPTEGEFRLLDPGAGVGSLTAAVVARMAEETPGVKLVVTGVENDEAVAGDLALTFQECEEIQAGNYHAIVADFVTWAAEKIRDRVTYDLVVMNPPYRKITKGSDEERAFSAAGVHTTNLYSGFVTLALRLLSPVGQVIAITPRSFANGAYFKSFRQELLRTVVMERIHVFNRRNEVFKDAEVLQENIIFSARSGSEKRRVTISTSDGFTDEPQLYEVDYSAVVQPDDPQSFIRVTTSAEGLEVAAQMAAKPSSLAQVGLEVMTGRVVDFRAKKHLRKILCEGDSPLIYPGHLITGGCRWPEGAPRKPVGIARNTETEWSLVPAGTYVIVKRFSAKEEPRRVVASLVRRGDLPGEMWGFENHLNIFHVDGHGIDDEAAKILVDYLNSKLVDEFVRLFNGHTQINAGDLRSLRYPHLKSIDLGAADEASEMALL